MYHDSDPLIYRCLSHGGIEHLMVRDLDRARADVAHHLAASYGQDREFMAVLITGFSDPWHCCAAAGLAKSLMAAAFREHFRGEAPG